MPYTEQEEDLIFDFDSVLNKHRARFETKELRQLGLSPVDFLLDLQDFYRFVEVKDPDNPNATNPARFAKEMKDGTIIKDLARKFRDSFFFFTLQAREPKKIGYFVLLSWNKLDHAQLLTMSERLRKAVPWQHKSYRNDHPLGTCVVLNLAEWKKKFGDDSVWRASDY